MEDNSLKATLNRCDEICLEMSLTYGPLSIVFQVAVFD